MKKEKTQAIALHYDRKNAPKVTAKGEGRLAEQIIDAARKHGIPLEQDPELTELLAQVDLNDEIPPSLYVAVAQLLVFLYHLDGQNRTR